MSLTHFIKSLSICMSSLLSQLFFPQLFLSVSLLSTQLLMLLFWSRPKCLDNLSSSMSMSEDNRPSSRYCAASSSDRRPGKKVDYLVQNIVYIHGRASSGDKQMIIFLNNK